MFREVPLLMKVGLIVMTLALALAIVAVRELGEDAQIDAGLAALLTDFFNKSSMARVHSFGLFL